MIQINHRAPDNLDRKNAEFIARLLPDYLRKAAGLPHKTSDALWDLRDSTLEQMAREIDPQHRSVNSSAFAGAMSDALTAILADAWPDLEARLNPFCRIHEVSNFQPAALVQVSFPDFSEPTREDGPVTFSPIEVTTTGTAQLQSYETRIKVSNVVWSTFGGELAQAVARHSYAIAKLELRLLAELLTTNPVLSDTDTLFTSDNSDAGALDLAGLDKSLAWLASGNPSGLTPSGLLIAPGKEATVRTLLDAAGMSLPVLVSPDLPDGSWYLFSNPDEHAAIVRLREKGASQRPQVGWVNVPGKMQKGYYSAFDTGFSAIDRNGIFRGGV
jgi:hypothetical protein